MSPARRVLVIQHEDKAPPGLVLEAVHRAGMSADVLAAQHGRAIPAALGELGALIVLGGSMNANDDAGHRWLLPTKALIAATVAAGRPFLGVCLGHQLAAVALGGTVGPHPVRPARGLLPWGPRSPGVDDPLTSALAPGTPVLHWNDDAVLSLPPTATTLASAPDGSVQAARFGPMAWGVQFHPEVDADLVAGWLASPEREDAEGESAGLRELRERQAALRPVWEHLLLRFCQLSIATEEASTTSRLDRSQP